MKKLYKVEMRVYVMAEDEEAAHNTATGIDVEIPIEDCEIVEASAVYHSWINGIPYGSDDDKTCGEILANKSMKELEG